MTGAHPSDRAGRASPEPASGLGHTAAIPCADVREHHGCDCDKGDVTLVELLGGIKIRAAYYAVLEPRHARYLARKLYHLARKIERRQASGIEAGTDETAKQAQPEGQEPGPSGDAQPPSGDPQ